MTIIGIDPGQSGGIAVLDGDKPAYALPMPKTPSDLYFLLCCSGLYGAVAYLELVHSMPKQGVASTAKFMRQVGTIEGILVSGKIRYEEVTPQKWQRALGCMTKGNKNVTKRKAQQLFPHLKITHALADALLIAEYGRRFGKL